MSAHSIPPHTGEEYLEMDGASEIPLERHDGEIFSIADATLAHSLLSGNVRFLLRNALGDGTCLVLPSPLRIEAGKSCVRPDISVVCGKPIYDEPQTILNPILKVEILSRSTGGYDCGAKFGPYRYPLAGVSENVPFAGPASEAP
jgi:Uma2 family endonuclease